VLVLQAGDLSCSLVHWEASRAARGALLRSQELASLEIRSHVAQKGVLVGAEHLGFVRISFGAFLGEKRGWEDRVLGKVSYQSQPWRDSLGATRPRGSRQLSGL
jgi:hypothetical protein